MSFVNAWLNRQGGLVMHAWLSKASRMLNLGVARAWVGERAHACSAL